MAGADDAKVPPVPIPNTEVKLGRAENTWLETTRENRKVPAHSFFYCLQQMPEGEQPQAAICALFGCFLLKVTKSNIVTLLLFKAFCLSWPVGQAVKTTASHAVIMGSIPVRVTILFVK